MAKGLKNGGREIGFDMLGLRSFWSKARKAYEILNIGCGQGKCGQTMKKRVKGIQKRGITFF